MNDLTLSRLSPKSMRSTYKRSLGQFLAKNPFSHPLTLGFFYREKMRAIHIISPDYPFHNILEVGGGQSGLTSLLYPNASITNLDLDSSYAQATSNRRPNVQFVCGDATELTFEDASFDAVTMFDVLEHIPDDRKAIFEALRVLKPGGFLLISTPNDAIWRFPYYSFLKPFCPQEASIMSEWGHVRRGYTLETIRMLIDLPCQGYATFINPITVIGHDIAFSSLSLKLRYLLSCALSPLTWLGYWLHHPTQNGTEIASVWQKI